MELLEVRGRRRDDVVDEPFGLDELGREGHDGRSLLSVAVARGPVRIELGRNAPPVDERHLGAPAIHLERGLFDRGIVASVAVDDRETPCAVPVERFEDGTHHLDHRFKAKVDRAGEVDVMRRDAKRNDGRDEELFHATVETAAELLRDEPVGAERAYGAVLFGRTDRHDDGTSLRLLEFRPGHVVHTAVATHCSTPLGWWWIGWSMNTPGSLGEGAGAEEIRCDSDPCRCFRGRGSSRPRRWPQRPPCTRPGRWTNRSGQSGQWR